MDIAAWLRRLGLEQYEQAFRDNDIDAKVLPDLTADDLTSIGVTSVGHRRKLLAAIGALSAAVPASAVMAASRDAPQADAERRQLTVMSCDLVGSTRCVRDTRPLADVCRWAASWPGSWGCRRRVCNILTWWDPRIV